MRTHSEAENRVLYLIDAYKDVPERLRALKDAGFTLEFCWIKGGGVSTVFNLKRKKIYRIQVAESELRGKYMAAWCVVLLAD
jgi:hypothetical protein